MINKTKTHVFLALVKAGLWEQDVRLSQFDEIDFKEVCQLAEEQSVVGLVAAGLGHVIDKKPPKEEVLQIVGQALMLEQQNRAMNYFIGVIVDQLRKENIYTLLLKGQGIAQCYERPLWRSCGDVDFFLSEDNYNKAKDFLAPLASNVEKENIRKKHLGMTILETFGTNDQGLVGPWVVELHGSLYCGLSSRIDRILDDVYQHAFYNGDIRSWDNNGVQIFQLGVENDTFYVFTHILQHFYKGGIGIRQICDWCRLLWTYRDKLDIRRIDSRIQMAGLKTEWMAFGAFAVNYLGLPAEAMPLYSPEKKWKKKADLILSFILEVGNFGHNRDMSYYGKYPYVIRKAISLGRRVGDLFRHAQIFPLDSLRFFPNLMLSGLRSAAKGEG